MPFKDPEAKRVWRQANREKAREHKRTHYSRHKDRLKAEERARRAAKILALPDNERALHYIMAAGHYARIQSAVAAYIREHTPPGGPMDTDANASRRHRARVRMAAIEKLGGRCEACGMDESAVLEFDHRAPVQRRTNGVRSHDSLGLCRDILRGEVDEVQLLCANCHTLKTRGNGEFGLNPINVFDDALGDAELWGTS